MISTQTDISLSDVLTSKQESIHRQMYEEALGKYVSYAGIDPQSYSFIEHRGSYFDTPSKVNAIQTQYPYRRQMIDLAPFWGEYKFAGDMSYLKLDDEMTVETSEVIYRDYARGFAELRSKMTGRSYKVALKDLDESIPEADDGNDPTDAFAYKIQHKIYGR